MKPGTPLAFLLAIALPTFAAAADRSSPDAVDRSVKAALRSCFKQAERVAIAEDRLLAPGLESCYLQASRDWQAAVDRLKGRRLAPGESVCREAIEAVEQAWNTYSESVVSLDPIQRMQLNTNDDLALIMRKHLYEMVYHLATGRECTK